MCITSIPHSTHSLVLLMYSKNFWYSLIMRFCVFNVSLAISLSSKMIPKKCPTLIPGYFAAFWNTILRHFWRQKFALQLRLKVNWYFLGLLSKTNFAGSCICYSYCGRTNQKDNTQWINSILRLKLEVWSLILFECNNKYNWIWLFLIFICDYSWNYDSNVIR